MLYLYTFWMKVIKIITDLIIYTTMNKDPR